MDIQYSITFYKFYSEIPFYTGSIEIKILLKMVHGQSSNKIIISFFPKDGLFWFSAVERPKIDIKAI